MAVLANPSIGDDEDAREFATEPEVWCDGCGFAHTWPPCEPAACVVINVDPSPSGGEHSTAGD